MAKEKTLDKVKLEQTIDEYLINNIPLSLLTEKYDLTYKQIQLLLNRIKGFEMQTDKLSDTLGSYNTEDYSENYLVIPHEIIEKYPLKSINQIALFKRLEELKNLMIEDQKENNPNQENNSSKRKALYEKEYQDIREELFVRNIKLVNWCIRNFFNNIPLPKEETQMYGAEGLVKVINGFDYTLGFQFSTYAVQTIVHHIERYFNELYGMDWQDFINKESIKYYRKLIREENPGRVTDVTPTELANTGLINLSARKIAGYDEMIDIILPFSDVNEEIEPDLKPTRANEMPMTFEDYDTIDAHEDRTSILDEDKDVDAFLDKNLRKDLLTSISTLTDREILVIKERFGLFGPPRTLKEVGKMINVDIERVRQIEAKAIRKLRHPLRSRRLRPYIKDDSISNKNYSSTTLPFNEKVIIKLAELLQKDISHDGLLIFMNFEGLNWTFEDLDKAVLDLKDLCEIAFKSNLDIFEFKKNLYYQRYIRITDKLAEYICNNNEKILNTAEQYISEYIKEETKKRR